MTDAADAHALSRWTLVPMAIMGSSLHGDYIPSQALYLKLFVVPLEPAQPLCGPHLPGGGREPVRWGCLPRMRTRSQNGPNILHSSSDSPQQVQAHVDWLTDASLLAHALFIGPLLAHTLPLCNSSSRRSPLRPLRCICIHTIEIERILWGQRTAL